VDVSVLVLLVVCGLCLLVLTEPAKRRPLTFLRGFAPFRASSWRTSSESQEVGSASKVTTTRPHAALGTPDGIRFRPAGDAPLVVTVYTWGELSRLEAATVHALARKLYRRCPFWTEASCDDIAERLARGLVVTVPDAEAVFLPGEFVVGDYVPSDSQGWTPAAVGVGASLD
jgi:hypothetical protein